MRKIRSGRKCLQKSHSKLYSFGPGSFIRSSALHHFLPFLQRVHLVAITGRSGKVEVARRTFHRFAGQADRHIDIAVGHIGGHRVGCGIQTLYTESVIGS